MKIIVSLLFTLLILAVAPSYAQVIPDPSSTSQQQAVRTELERRGLNEAEVEQRLAARGIDLENITPTDIPVIESILDEMEREAAAQTAPPAPLPPTTTPPPTTTIEEEVPAGVGTEIEEAVEDGASIEEAVSEAIIDANNEPGSNQKARIYGHQLFRDQSISIYRQSDNVKPSPDYILGAGDEVAIQIFGNALGTFVYEISPTGYISPERMQPIYLKGLSLEQARDLVRRRFNAYYPFRSDQFTMTVTTARTIQVNIYGNVQRSGAYTISAVNTAFNALAAAGGPNDIGTVRKIQINRTGEPSRVLDLYDLLMRGEQISDTYLANNDYIFVPIARRVVEISGAIRRPYAYELIEGEQLLTLIDYAGGLSENAYAPNIAVRRYSGDREEIFNIDYNELISGGTDFTLQPGDRVTVREQLREVKNVVRIEGAVDFANEFAVAANGTRTSELVGRATPRDDARLDRAYLFRLNSDSTYTFSTIDLEAALASPGSEADVLLQDGDRLRILSSVRRTNFSTISVRGAVERGSDDFPFDPSRSLRVRDAIELAGGLNPTATDYGYIYRTDLNNPTIHDYIEFDVSEVMDNPDSPQNIALEPNDVVRIYSILAYEDEFTIRVSGEVRSPTVIPFAENLTLQDALRFAEGLKYTADPGRIDVFRKVLRAGEPVQVIAATVEVDPNLGIVADADFILEPLDQVIVRRIPDFVLEESVLIEGEVAYPGEYPILNANERLSNVIQRSGGLSLEAFPEGARLFRSEDDLGYVVMRLDEVLEDENSTFNLVLKAGDRIFIPKSQDFVTIRGAMDAVELYPSVVTQDGRIAVAYQGNMRAAEYIDEYAAGPSKNADKSRIAVLHPNGEIKKTKNFLFFRVTPKVRKGSIISIPTKPQKEEGVADSGEERERVDWNQVIADSIGQATAILSLILLVQRVNN